MEGKKKIHLWAAIKGVSKFGAKMVDQTGQQFPADKATFLLTVSPA